MQEQNGAVKQRRGPGFLRYIPVKIILTIAILAAVFGAGVGVRSVLVSGNKLTRLGFEDIGELATQAAYCTEVNVTEGARELFGLTIPFTQSKYVYSYDVVIKAGLDFGEIDWTVGEDTITVRLPEIRILSSEIDLDSFRVYVENESIFRRISLEENNEAMKALQASAQENAVANGLLDNARANAETILTGFFAGEYDLSTPFCGSIKSTKKSRYAVHTGIFYSACSVCGSWVISPPSRGTA